MSRSVGLRVPFALLGLLPLLSLVVADFALPPLPIEMQASLLPCIGWIIFALLTGALRDRINQLAGLILIFIVSVGNMNAMGSYFKYGAHFRVNIDLANWIFLALSFSFLVGIFLAERCAANSSEDDFNLVRPRSGEIVYWVLLLFPLIWFADQFIAIGRIPILSGRSIVNEMYGIEYGRLYGYGVIVSLAGLLIWTEILATESIGRKVALSMYLVLVCAIMMFDGRRVLFLLFLVGVLVVSAKARVPMKRFLSKMSVLLLFALLSYVALLYFRQGRELIKSNPAVEIFTLVGVEYRDFAYFVSHVPDYMLSGYDWLGSALAAFFHWFVLALFGISKGSLVQTGSAYQFGPIMGTTFGIRVGFLPEIFIAYGWWSLLIAFLFGVITAMASLLVRRARTVIGSVVAAIVFANLVLAHIGQTTVMTGYFSILCYFLLFWLSFNWLGDSLRATRRDVTAQSF